jgi:hypothetical protein
VFPSKRRYLPKCMRLGTVGGVAASIALGSFAGPVCLTSTHHSGDASSPSAARAQDAQGDVVARRQEGHVADATAEARPLLNRRAERCLDEPTCTADDADLLFRAADDAHETDLDCFRFLDGQLTKRDLTRARACLDREVDRTSCDGSSAGLAHAELSIMRTDALGGPQDLGGARKIFDGCFDDATKREVLDHAAAKERDPSTPPMDFCRDYGGTTLTSDECGARARTREATRALLQAKQIAVSLNDGSRKRFVLAATAYDAYVNAMGGYIYEVYRDGTVRNSATEELERGLIARRTNELVKFPRFTPSAASKDQVDAAEKRVEDALRKATARAPTPAVRDAVQAAQQAWLAFRDAEVALYTEVHGAQYGVERVRASVLVGADRARARDLER